MYSGFDVNFSGYSGLIKKNPEMGRFQRDSQFTPDTGLITKTTMTTTTTFDSYLTTSNLVVLWTPFVTRVKKQQLLLRQSWGHRMSRLCQHFLFVLFALTVILSPASAQADSLDNEYKGLMGEEVEIPCLLRSADVSCPRIHSITWYQNGQRMYYHIDTEKVNQAEGRFQPNRAVYKANDTPPVLLISPVQIADEGVYRCVATYTGLIAGCPVESSAELKTFAKPQAPEIFLDTGEASSDSVTATLIGPFHEGDVVTLTCESAGGKPPAQVTWWKDSESLAGYFSEEDDDDGTKTGKSTVRIPVTKENLLVRYTCQVNHETLDEALSAWIQMDVYVPPQTLEFVGNNTRFEDQVVALTCTARGARPAAVIRWYNGSSALLEQPPVYNSTENGGTFTSYSTLTFPASRFDDEEVFSCEAANQAMDDGHRDPLKNSTTLTIYYPPIVTLLPDEDILEINESSPLRLECAFEANPVDEQTTVMWVRNSDSITVASDNEDDDSNGKDSDRVQNGNIDDNNNNNKQDDQNGNANGNQDAVKEGRFHYVIKSIHRHHGGAYSCMVRNIAGIGTSENTVNVSVLYPPEVRMIIFPTLAIEHKTNVTLTCEIEDANPTKVTSVRWYRNDELFNETHETTLFLSEVDRSFHSNYSCQAENRVGWSNISEPILLSILYTPGSAKLTHKPNLVIKDQPVTLFCEVQDLGNPPATEYIWKRGEFFIEDGHTHNWTIKKASLGTDANYICIPRNNAGDGVAGTLNLDVYAPPAFIDALLPYHGALETATDISLTCQVECHPMCTIEWLRDGELLQIASIEGSGDQRADGDEDEDGNANASNGLENETTYKSDRKGNDNGNDDDGDDVDVGDYYSVKISHLPSNTQTNHFSSVVSTLRWNMTAWPKGRLNRVGDTANYTCRSSHNIVGPGISNTTVFNVEYPPENISLSSYKVNVEEEEDILSPVTCLASGHPEVSYVWTYDGKPVSSTNELRLNYPASRERSGLYYCTATNLHGNASSSVFLDVLYKPECKLDASKEEDIGTVLICKVVANPAIVDFEWLLGNETVEENIHTAGLTSRLTQVRAGGRYICIVNNSVGQSEACILELQDAAFVAAFGDNRIILIVIVVAAIIIIAVIIAFIIYLFLKRRRAVGKLDKQRRSDQPPGPVSDGDRAFYENLPFHGLQPAPNKPFKPALPDLEYADVDFPPQAPQADGTPTRPPRTGKPVANNNHA